ncbi:hypothetical protein CCAX7_50210 [Capsulimonas corticalis]|uniref:Uncharacterized protein n=1 Tax=Capsulimonas corticalis TaxID=2219043 RepID=A0A402CPQ3_9BACT|nr:hypothetical protein [Capsulimonas corticalis]BDI32970.1 hypothetical protein CCAX7_50210 [Capsulimonas corticalis]
MNSVYAQTTNRNAARRGTSLIEILVVLVILVFGILSVIRLFPAGFLVFRAAQNNGVAQRMGGSLLESVSKDNSAIADGIYIYRDDIGYDPTTAPDDTGKWKLDPKDPAYMDINKARRVVNETITVPPARAVTPANGQYSWASVHVLNYGPAVVNHMMPRVIDPGNSITVTSAPWTARIASSLPSGSTTDNSITSQDGTAAVDDPKGLLTSGNSEYLIDYDRHLIAVPSASYAQRFEFSVMTDAGVGICEYLVPAGLGDTWDAMPVVSVVNGAALPLTVNWIKGSAVLYRPFTLLDGGDAPTTPNDTITSKWSADPYEFQLRKGNVGPSVNMGVLDFNPLGAGGNGAQPLKARISYNVYDWHLLHEDRDLPVVSEDRTIRLAIDNLKKIGDAQYDQTLFSGIFGPLAPADLIICNLENGDSELFSSSANAVDLDGDATDKTKVGISYKNGRVTFPKAGAAPVDTVYNDPAATPNSNGLHLRIYYMGQADWGVAIQKAPAYYTAATKSSDLTAPRPGYLGPVNLYGVNVDASGNVQGVDFPFCDFGKTVSISGTVNYYDSSGNGYRVPLPTTSSAINQPVILNGKSVGFIPLAGIAQLANYDSTKPVTITSVRGVSANAIVVWRENDQWKHRVIDTLLPRTQ